MSRSYPSRTVLDEQKRWKIITLISNGSSRRVAARFVGCSPSTITRTAARDPDFAAQLAAAEQATEIEALRALRAAIRKDRYWRAAAWLLERKNPEDFFLCNLELLTIEQVTSMIHQILEALCEDLPEIHFQRAKRKLDELMDLCREEELFVNLRRYRVAKRRIQPALPKPPVQHPSSELHEFMNPTPAVNPQSASTSICNP